MEHCIDSDMLTEITWNSLTIGRHGAVLYCDCITDEFDHKIVHKNYSVKTKFVNKIS